MQLSNQSGNQIERSSQNIVLYFIVVSCVEEYLNAYLVYTAALLHLWNYAEFQCTHMRFFRVMFFWGVALFIILELFCFQVTMVTAFVMNLDLIFWEKEESSVANWDRILFALRKFIKLVMLRIVCSIPHFLWHKL